MNLLLDTGIFIWTFTNSHRLPSRLRDAILNPENELFLSIISIWEMQIKEPKGGLGIVGTVNEFVEAHVLYNEIQLLSLDLPHIWKLGELPIHHKDPFDRILIAQAISEEMTLLSVDRFFPDYPVQLLN